MADPETDHLKGRAAGGTEHSWCKAVPGGTGITVLAILLSKAPDFSLLQSALHKLQNAYPILRSKLHFEPKTNTFSFLTSQNPYLQLQTFDLSSTSTILQSHHPNPDSVSVSPFHLIFEHELNLNPWRDPDPSSDTDLFFASVYTLSDDEWVATLRLHTAVCDRTAAVALLRKLLELAGGGRAEELGKEEELSLGIEDMIPSGKTNKPFWARGVNMLGYSLNSLRLTNLNFMDANSPRSSELVRLHLPADHTSRIIAGCESREIKVSGALAAAALIAAHAAYNNHPEGHWAKYGVTTLVDCRSILDPLLPADHIGFYHSAILNTHDVNGSETLWELADRTYKSYADAKKYNKHFSDMADLNFLMCRAIENPSLTPSGSLRTSLVSVFEDCVIDDSNQLYQEMGVKDYVGCGSAHGVGPSIALFHTIRDGRLDCACVYPSPLHSREQMLQLVESMKRILIHGCATE